MPRAKKRARTGGKTPAAKRLAWETKFRNCKDVTSVFDEAVKHIFDFAIWNRAWLEVEDDCSGYFHAAVDAKNIYAAIGVAVNGNWEEEPESFFERTKECNELIAAVENKSVREHLECELQEAERVARTRLKQFGTYLSDDEDSDYDEDNPYIKRISKTALVNSKE